jgi:hypothetical protein
VLTFFAGARDRRMTRAQRVAMETRRGLGLGAEAGSKADAMEDEGGDEVGRVVHFELMGEAGDDESAQHALEIACWRQFAADLDVLKN